MINHIVLDMDGVLCDFAGAALKIFNAQHKMNDWPLGQWDIAPIVGVEPEVFWHRIEACGRNWWKELKPTPWKDEVITIAQEFPKWSIATSPSMDPYCLSGKLAWMYQHIQQGFRDYFITPKKEMLAQEDRVLIDDRDKNVLEFRAWGGEAILFPQPWNSNHFVKDRIGYVRKELDRICATTQAAA